MNKPWEIVMQFQEKLKQPAAAVNPSSKQLNSVVQHFKPSGGKDIVSRLKKVKDIVNESCRVIEESRPPALNTTVVSFCQNCTCTRCSHQSSILESDGDLNSTISAVVQSYETFLEMQKQQFLAMIGQLTHAAGLSTSIGGIAVQQSCAVLSSGSDSNKVGAVECDSSVKSKTTVNHMLTSDDQSTEQSAQSQEFESPTSTVDEESSEDHCSSTCTLIAEEENQSDSMDAEEETQLKSTDVEVNSKQLMNEKRQECEIYSCESFDDYHDENFKPVRKSFTKKYKDCSVILDRLDDGNKKPSRNETLGKQKLVPLNHQKQCSASEFEIPQKDRLPCEEKLSHSSDTCEDYCNTGKNVKNKLPGHGKSNIRDSHEKEKLLADLTIMFDNKAPEPVTKETNGAEDVKRKTRSGRTVQNPGQFWKLKSTSTPINTSDKQQPQPTAAKPKGRSAGSSSNKSGVRTSTKNVPISTKTDGVQSASYQIARQKGKGKEAKGSEPEPPLLGSESKTGRRRKRKSATLHESSESENGSEPTQKNRMHEKVSTSSESSVNDNVQRKRTKRYISSSESSAICNPRNLLPPVKETVKSSRTRKNLKEKQNIEEDHGKKRRGNPLKPTQSNLSNRPKKNISSNTMNSKERLMRTSSSETAEPDFVCYFEGEHNDTWGES